MNSRKIKGFCISGLMLITLAGCGYADGAEGEQGFADGQGAYGQMQQGGMQQGGMQQGGMQQANMQQANMQQDGAQQALQGLAQIRQEQCQSGNQLACQDLNNFQARGQKLAQLSQACQSGDSQACGGYKSFAESIFTAYSESAAVMRNGREAMAQMDAWRGQMNRNAATSLANLRAMGAAGQAAHEARQASYAAQNRAWQAGQDMSDRTQGRTIDTIYGGTTMSGGGVQTRVEYGQTGYTDGYGNVVSVPQGGAGPDGWQQMEETYAVPQ